MGKVLKLAGLAVLASVIVVAALLAAGVWRLPPSAADRAHARTLFSQAQDAQEAGDQQGALQALNESIRLDAQNDALRERAALLMAQNDYDGALADLNTLIGRGGGLAENYSARCWLRARGEALAEARRDCDRAIATDPALASAFGNRGLVGLRQRRFQEAWDDFNTALRVGGSDEWVAWRVFGRGVAAWGKGSVGDARQDVETALHANPAVAAQFAEFGVGGEIMGELEGAAYTAATSPRSLEGLQQYLLLYPAGAHVAEARAHVAEIIAALDEDEATGRRSIAGFSLAQARGSGPASDSFGAIAISRTGWRVGFVTDYATAAEAEAAGARVCQSTGLRCDAYAFRNVCAAIALSPPQRVEGLAWAYARDDAMHTAMEACRERGGRACVPIHSQCTPTPPAP